MSANKLLVGVYDDDHVLMDAVTDIRGNNVEIDEVFTPFPVHGLEHKLGYKESRLPTVAFIGGAVGFLAAVTMQVFMYTIDWQINVGGKPTLPFPSFIPISFELTVLFASLGMVAAYLIVNDLKPHAKPDIIDPRQTDDLFLITIEATDDEERNQKVREMLKKTGAIDVREHQPH